MIVGAELKAMADAEAAIELADAARGTALLEALDTLTRDDATAAPEPRSTPPPRSCGRWSRRASSATARRRRPCTRSPSAASSRRRSCTARRPRRRSSWRGREVEGPDPTA